MLIYFSKLDLNTIDDTKHSLIDKVFETITSKRHKKHRQIKTKIIYLITLVQIWFFWTCCRVWQLKLKQNTNFQLSDALVVTVMCLLSSKQAGFLTDGICESLHSFFFYFLKFTAIVLFIRHLISTSPCFPQASPLLNSAIAFFVKKSCYCGPEVEVLQIPLLSRLRVSS